MTSVTEAPRPPRRQEERRAETRAKLLRAAGRVFAKRGYHAATLDEVAKTAGLSKGSVYYNFGSKDELFVTLLEDRYRAQLEYVRDALATGVGGKAAAAGSGFLNRVQRDPRWPPLFFEFVAHAARDPKLRARFGTWVRDTRSALVELVDLRARQLGMELPLPADELALAVSALANGMLIEAIFDPEAVPATAFDELICLLLTGDPSRLEP